MLSNTTDNFVNVSHDKGGSKAKLYSYLTQQSYGNKEKLGQSVYFFYFSDQLKYTVCMLLIKTCKNVICVLSNYR
jgi:hypothetical protein